MQNIYADRLDAFTAEDMYAALEAVGDETQRLELKSKAEKHVLAHVACSMANADGGIIAVGFNEPNPKNDVSFGLADDIDVSNRTRTALAAAMHARVHPPMPLEIEGYETAGPGRGFLVIRIGRSDVAPHEYMKHDLTPNLPVRRDTAIASLTLAEIDALRTRGSSFPVESPIKVKAARLSIEPYPINPDCIFGVKITPVRYLVNARVLDTEDDRLCAEIARATEGVDRSIHGRLELITTRHSAWLHSGPPRNQDPQRPSQPHEQIEIFSDGEVAVRFVQTSGDAFTQYVFALLTAYVAAQEAFFAFGLAPQARVHVVMRLTSERTKAEPPLPAMHEDWFTIDLAADGFTQAFTETTMLLWRAANKNTKRDNVRDLLRRHAESYLPYALGLEDRW